MDIEIARISQTGLTKNIFGFTCEHGHLQYVGHFVACRSTTADKWADEWPPAFVVPQMV